MDEYEKVEADFRQYYSLDLNEMFTVSVDSDKKRYLKGFYRYSRLFINLPPESRIMRKLCPIGDWSWNDEVQSRILNELSQLKCLIYNINRGKKAPLKPDEQFQPSYIEDYKKAIAKQPKREKLSKEDTDRIRDFWESRMNSNNE